MPQKVNTQDETNFLKDGYVSRTQATRDGAGNIKLYEDTTVTTNTTIMVEPVTSQFSVETALKLFETRFEYFKFPVQTVAAGSLKDIDKSINEDVANTLAGVSFEQDVITRRMELVPLVEGSDVIEWYVPTPWGEINYHPSIEDEEATFNVAPGGGEFEPSRRFTSEYRKPFYSKLRSNEINQSTWLTTWYGLQRIDVSNSNSPRGKSWFRITPEMLNQIKIGGKFDTINGDVFRTPFKRNIKLTINIEWTPESDVYNAFKNHSFIKSSKITETNYNRVNLRNGVCLIASINSTWHDAWNREGQYNEPQQPIFVQSTSDQIGNGINSWGRDDDQQVSTVSSYNAVKYQYQSMNIEYVIDSRDLFWGTENNPDDVSSAQGLYREYCLELMCNHPVKITKCTFDVSVEQLPDDFITNIDYKYSENKPKQLYVYDTSMKETKSDKYKSLYGKFTYNSQWFSGVRKINGTNILGIQNGSSRLVVGYTDNNAKWNLLHTWKDKKWIRPNKYAVFNDLLFSPSFAKDTFQQVIDKVNRFNTNKAVDMIRSFKELDSVVKIITTNSSNVDTNVDTNATNSPAQITGDMTLKAAILIVGGKTYTLPNSGGSNASIEYDYTGGNGGSYDAITIASTNTNGVNLVLPSNKNSLNNGAGTLKFYIVGYIGDPGAGKTTKINFAGNVFGKPVTLSLTVRSQTVSGNSGGNNPKK